MAIILDIPHIYIILYILLYIIFSIGAKIWHSSEDLGIYILYKILFAITYLVYIIYYIGIVTTCHAMPGGLHEALPGFRPPLARPGPADLAARRRRQPRWRRGGVAAGGCGTVASPWRVER